MTNETMYKTMKFNKQKLKNIGINGMTNNELIGVLKFKIEYLLTHNKNYTKTQYYNLQDIAELITALE